MDRDEVIIAIGGIAALVALFLYYEYLQGNCVLCKKLGLSKQTQGISAPTPARPPITVNPPRPTLSIIGNQVKLQTPSGPVEGTVVDSGGGVPSIMLPSGEVVSGVGYISGETAPGEVVVNYSVYKRVGWTGPGWKTPVYRWVPAGGNLLLLPPAQAAKVYGVSSVRGMPALYANLYGVSDYEPWDNVNYPISSITPVGSDTQLDFKVIPPGYVQVPAFVYQ
jgi:hypothetical protein